MSFDEDEWPEDTGCTFPHGQDDWCPECCCYGGVFSSGTEDCEFCSYASYCEQVLLEDC